MIIDIAYCDWFEKTGLHCDTDPRLNSSWTNLLNYDVEKLDSWKDSKSNYNKCPAFVNYIDQIWVLKSALDLDIEWNSQKKKIISNLPSPSHDLFIKTHDGDFNPYVDRPIVALNTCVLFLADNDVWVDFMPPFNHIDHKWRLIPGTFNIYNWQRPVVPTFEMIENKITIKRGQPLAYFRFRSHNPKDVFKLSKVSLTADIENLVMSCSSVKFFQRNISWKIITGLIPNKLRPRKLLKWK